MFENDYLEGYRDAEAYDLEDGDYVADQPLIEQWAKKLGGPLLDLACGTGTMAIHMAKQDYAVTGVDIIPEMIELATKKASAEALSIDWLVDDARTFQLGKQFAFIYLIGNAFQHFLTRADHEALFARVREHLQPDGHFLFNTRNPSPKNLFEGRFAEPQTYVEADGTKLIATEQPHYDPMTQLQHYTFHNQWIYPDGRQQEKTYHTALRYVFPQEMETLLHYNGFQIEASYGNWAQEPLTAASPSMIYVCRKRD